jgi:hypothetical protein
MRSSSPPRAPIPPERQSRPIYDPSTAPGGKFHFKSFLALVQSRLHRSPVFRQKLRSVPFGLDELY